MAAENTLHGWACPGKDKPLEWREMPLKTFDDDTVEIKVTHCGICGSDIHTLDSGWGPTIYPCVVGHEIAGIATRVGKNVKHIREGDRVGVGAQSGSCLKCKDCKSHHENICQVNPILTYNSRWPTGEPTYGGYADKWRGHQRFVFRIPDSMTNEVAATFFCAGITTYSPLKRYGVGPNSKVGILGLGGLGHYAVMWSKAMGAKVVVLSHSDRKKDDAAALGADEYVVTSDSEAMKKHCGSFSHIVCTNFSNTFDWAHYFSMMDTNSFFIMLALPEAPLTNIPAGPLVTKQVSLVGSAIGSPDMIEDMLKFAAEKNIKPWLMRYPMSKAPEAVQAMRDGKARYRFVLEN